MFLIGTVAAVLALAREDDDVIARFSAHQALSRVDIDVAIHITGKSPDDPSYWISRTIRKPRQKTQTSEFYTRTCPQMLAVLRSLHDLPMPRAYIPPQDPLFVVADGTGYSLTIDAAYPEALPGELTLHSNVGTPLAAWIDDALATLDSCPPK
jgi:hypothetical protein